MDIQALLLTLRLAATTTVALLALGVPLSAWIVYGRSPLRPVTEALTTLPLILPPTVLGFYALMLMGPLTAPGRLIIRLLGHPLAFSFAGLLAGSALYSLPFMIQPLVTTFRAIDHKYIELAATSGISPLRTFAQVILPLSSGGITTAVILTILHTIGEFGVVLMIGGNIPGVTRTLSIAIYDRVQDLDYASANHTALLLLLASFLGLLVIYSRRATGNRGRLV